MFDSLGFGSGPNYGKIAGTNERKRQGLINLGMKQINALYGGGSAPFYSLAGTEPLSRAEWKAGGSTAPYYHLGASGNIDPFYISKKSPARYGTQEGAIEGAKYGSIVPGLGTIVGSTTGGIVGGLSSGDYAGAGLAAASGGALPIVQSLFENHPSAREIVNSKLKKGLLFNAPDVQSFEGFQPSFYDKRAKDYVDYALPQLADQYRTNRSAILYGLENRGLGASTVSDQARAGLERTVGQGRQTIADTGQEQANQLRKDVENSRQQSIAQLYQTADPAQAFQGALRATTELQRPSTFAPIANLFSNLANQYYTNQLLNAYRQPYGISGQQGGMSLSGALGPGTY